MAGKLKRGRPTNYDPALHPELALSYYSEGKTDAEVCKEMGISHQCLWEWTKKHQEFGDARKKGKDLMDTKVEASLFKRATGYSHDDVHITAWQGDVITTPIKKHYPPDATSMIFWLKNRKPKEWRDKQELETKLEAGDSLTDLMLKIRSSQK